MIKPLIKICGITTLDDAECVVEQGVDFMGFCFVQKSPRYVSPDCVRWIVDRLTKEVKKVGVFVNTPVDRIETIAQECRLDIIQLHGDEPASVAQALGVDRVWKAMPIWNQDDLEAALEYPAAAILVDSITAEEQGGTGRVGDWQLAARLAHKRKVVLAGGLTAANVAPAVKTVKPYAVDVCSGIEKTPGMKDYDRLHAFVKNVRRCSSD